MTITKNKQSIYAKRLKAIQEVSKTIVSDLYLDDILCLIVTVTAKVMGSKICSLMLLDEEKKELVIRSSHSVSKAYNKKPNIKLGEGISGQVAKENKEIQVIDVKKNSRYVNKNIAVTENLCSLLSVPLSVKGRVIGVINSYTSKPHKFTKSETETLIAVANQAAIVIENAQLMVKTKIIQEEMETRKLVERAKGILMKENRLSEEESFRRLQRKSMDNRKSMKEIAEAIIISHQVL